MLQKKRHLAAYFGAAKKQLLYMSCKLTDLVFLPEPLIRAQFHPGYVDRRYLDGLIDRIRFSVRFTHPKVLRALRVDHVPVIGPGRSREDDRLAPADFIYNEPTAFIRRNQ